MRMPCEHDRTDRAKRGKRALDALTQHAARRGIADHGQPAAQSQ
jgi:hypothetical protein